MADVAKIDAGFVKRGDSYQIRRVVPRDLRPFLKRREILKSLKTGDADEAVRRFHIESAKLDAYFEEQRQLMNSISGEAREMTAPTVMPALTPQQIRNRIVEDDLRERELLFRTAGKIPIGFGQVILSKSRKPNMPYIARQRRS